MRIEGLHRVLRGDDDGHEAEENLLSATHLPWRLEARTAPYDRGEVARLRVHALGAARLVDCAVTPAAGYRSRREIALTEDEWVIAVVNRHGRELFEQGDTSARLDAGNVLVWHSTAPARFAIQETQRKQTLFVPRALIDAACPALEWRNAIALAADDSTVRLFSEVLGGITRTAGELDDAARDTASRVLVELLTTCLRPHQTVGRAALQAGLFTYACDYIAGRVVDPSLTPEQVAAAVQVPLRTLQDVFAHRGETISGHIRHLRLTRCHDELQRHPSQTVTDVALRFGFKNVTHFSRRFRDRYGISPRELRAAAREPVARR